MTFFLNPKDVTGKAGFVQLVRKIFVMNNINTKGYFVFDKKGEHAPLFVI